MSVPIGSPDLCNGSRVKLSSIENLYVESGNVKCPICNFQFNILPRKKGSRFPKHLKIKIKKEVEE